MIILRNKEFKEPYFSPTLHIDGRDENGKKICIPAYIDEKGKMKELTKEVWDKYHKNSKQKQKSYSGYEPTLGTGYVSSVQLRDAAGSGIYNVADTIENTAERIGKVHPTVGKMTEKVRTRIKGYTKPIKSFIQVRKGKFKKSKLGYDNIKK